MCPVSTGHGPGKAYCSGCCGSWLCDRRISLLQGVDAMRWIIVLMIVAACKTCGTVEVSEPIQGDYTTTKSHPITLPIFCGFGDE